MKTRTVKLIGLGLGALGLSLMGCPFGPATLDVLHFACKTDPDCSSQQKCVIDNETLQTGHCQSKSCLNATLDEGETDVDCGGGLCPRCPDRSKCKGDGDCRSRRCVLAQDDVQRCMAAPVDAGAATNLDGGVLANCGDGQQNGDETDADCGGSCAACPYMKVCQVDRDCSSGVCAPLGDTRRCVPPATFRVVGGTLTITACTCGPQTAPCGADECMGDEVCDGEFCRAGCDVTNQDCPMPGGFKCDKGSCVPDGTSTCNGADFGFFCAAPSDGDAGPRPRWGFSTCDLNQTLVCSPLP